MSYQWNHTTCEFCIWLLLPNIMSWGSSILYCVSTIHGSLMCHCMEGWITFYYPFIFDRLLGRSHFLAIMRHFVRKVYPGCFMWGVSVNSSYTQDFWLYISQFHHPSTPPAMDPRPLQISTKQTSMWWTWLFLFFIFKTAICCVIGLLSTSSAISLKIIIQWGCVVLFFSPSIVFIFLSLFIFPVFILVSTFHFGGFLKSYIWMWGPAAEMVGGSCQWGVSLKANFPRGPPTNVSRYRSFLWSYLVSPEKTHSLLCVGVGGGREYPRLSWGPAGKRWWSSPVWKLLT